MQISAKTENKLQKKKINEKKSNEIPKVKIYYFFGVFNYTISVVCVCLFFSSGCWLVFCFLLIWLKPYLLISVYLFTSQINKRIYWILFSFEFFSIVWYLAFFLVLSTCLHLAVVILEMSHMFDKTGRIFRKK